MKVTGSSPTCHGTGAAPSIDPADFVLRHIYCRTSVANFFPHSAKMLPKLLSVVAVVVGMADAVADLQTCISKFVVQKDKIIRTQDSKDMGAKYLTEIDLGSRDECLRLCCETESCDVFVYEEKNSGSCYLFFCGPPEDFKCKFTHHVNYSSAVLTINRHLPDLESQIKLTKHEQDLSRLRKPETEVEAKPPVPPVQTTTTTTTTVGTKELLPVVRTKTPDQMRKCSRYQFECRSTGECIAIYNACDGIPQCTDGSDEAPELGCPDSLTTSNSIQIHPTQPPVYNQNPNLPASSQQQPVDSPALLQQPEDYRLPEREQPLARVPLTRQEGDFLRPVAVVPETIRSPNHPIQQQSGYEQQVAGSYGQQQPDGWVPHQSNQMQRPVYLDKNNHIFNHKDAGLQVQNGQETSQLQYPEVGNGHNYQKLTNYYGDLYRPQVPQSFSENWPVNVQEDPRLVSSNMNIGASNEGFVPETKWHPQVPENIARSMNFVPPAQIATYSNEKAVPVSVPEQENPKKIQEKMADDLKQSKFHMQQETTILPNVETTTEKSEHVQSLNEYINSMAYKMEAEKMEEEMVETPSGAVLTLTLGLIITFFTALLIGCRLRVVRKRMRRCGKSFAHDADYLVNGMYL